MPGHCEIGSVVGDVQRSFEANAGSKSVSMVLESIYRSHVVMMRNCARRLLGSEAMAEDIVQQGFLKYIEYKNGGGAEDNTGAFLYRTVTNLALNLIRDSRSRKMLLDAQQRSASSRDPVEERLVLREVLEVVTEEEARIAAYYYFEGLDQEEISELLGIERRTVGRRLQRFNERARELLNGRGEP
jgi:RNA polymerase sigma-70 factor (ECF subfamily)